MTRSYGRASLLGLLVLIVVGALAGCTAAPATGPDPSVAPAGPTRTATPTTKPSATPTPRTASSRSGSPTASATPRGSASPAGSAAAWLVPTETVDRVAGSTGDTLGVAVVLVSRAGGQGRPVRVDVAHAGTWSTGPAWSTAKVPLVMAALSAEGGDRADRRALARSAIVQSDNAAADRLWSGLGTPTVAGAAVQRQLRAAGDPTTVVQTRQVRPPYSAFGQTTWTLTDSARFAAGLPCVPAAAPALALMTHVESDQRWGLGRVDGVAFKGGWGPRLEGGYLARQLGVLVTGNGDVWGIALAAASRRGFASATADLDRLSDAIATDARRHGVRSAGLACPD